MTRSDVQITHLQRQIENLKKEETDLTELSLKIKSSEDSIKRITEEKSLMEKTFKASKEKQFNEIATLKSTLLF